MHSKLWMWNGGAPPPPTPEAPFHSLYSTFLNPFPDQASRMPPSADLEHPPSSDQKVNISIRPREVHTGPSGGMEERRGRVGQQARGRVRPGRCPGQCRDTVSRHKPESMQTVTSLWDLAADPGIQEQNPQVYSRGVNQGGRTEFFLLKWVLCPVHFIIKANELSLNLEKNTSIFC